MAVFFSSEAKQCLYENRFCNQRDFDIIISGNQNDLANTEIRSTTRISYPELKKIETLYSSIKQTDTESTIGERTSIWTICSKGIFRNYKHKDLFIDSFRIYLDKTDQWIKLIQLPDNRVSYCSCSFMNNLYVFGGYNGHSLRNCLKYNCITSKWTNIVNMNTCKHFASCTVYEGKIVVTGGQSKNRHLKLVEAYNHHENKWNNLPDMIVTRYKHGAVRMGNKMFVIGGNYNSTCEVFDSSCRKFTSIKELLVMDSLNYYGTSVVSIGYKIFAFSSFMNKENSRFQIYDVLNDQWCLEKYAFIDGKRNISCSKLPLV